MLKYFSPISGMVSLLLFFGCQKEETVDRDYPRIRTAAVNEITDEGATFNATVLSGSLEAVTEYGFVWGTTDYLSVDNSEKIIISETPDNSGFSCDITFALEAMKKYFVRAYVKAGEKVIYGDVVQFMSLGSQAPQIDDFYPKSGVWGDTITITGTNFSYQNLHMVVYVGDKIASVVQSTNEHIKAVIPYSLDKIHSQVHVEISGNRSTAQELFHLVTPAYITSIANLTATWGDTLIINGVFPYTEHTITFAINHTTVPLIQTGTSVMKFQVPNNLPFTDSLQIQIIVDKHPLDAPHGVKFEKPRIDVISPAIYGWLDTITLNGLFNPIAQNNVVKISGIQATILSTNGQQIKFIIPDAVPEHTASLVVYTGKYELKFNGSLSLSGPIIYSVNPNLTRSGFTVNLYGKYFKANQTTLFINGIETSCYVNNSVLLQFSAPKVETNGYVNIKVKVYNKETSRNDILSIRNPAITDFSPKTVTFGDVVTITGVEFEPEDLEVSWGGYSVEVIEKTATKIRFIVPANAPPSGRIVVKMGETYVYAYDLLNLALPQINSISSSSGRAGDQILITGSNFNPEIEHEVVFFNDNLGLGSPATILAANPNQLTVVVPSVVRANPYTVSLNVNGNTVSYSGSFTIFSPWQKLSFNTLPNSYGSNIYLHHPDGSGLNDLDEVFTFGGFNNYGAYQVTDFTNKNSFFINSMPLNAPESIGGSVFTIDGNVLYLVADIYNNLTQTVYSLDPKSRQWTIMSEIFPGVGRKHAATFSISDTTAYILGGLTNSSALSDFWVFHGKTKTWENLNNYPGGETYGAVAVVYSANAYLLDNQKLWRYSAETNSWTSLKDFPGTPRKMATGFTLNGKIYFGTGNIEVSYYNNSGKVLSDMWEYSPLSNTWKRLTDLPIGPRSNAFGFEMNGKGYIGGGCVEAYFGQVDIFEYDPNYE